MPKRNAAIANIKASYLFPEIAKRRREFEEANPGPPIISLGIGNTTEPIMPHINSGLIEGARKLGTAEGYTGYGDEQGIPVLRERIARIFYPGIIAPDEVFVSDGAKCDIGRLQLLFGAGIPVTVQDPSYPVYVDGSVFIGAAGAFEGSGYKGITYLPCTKENGFFPDLSMLPEGGLIYYCSPNNPTGAVSNREQLTLLIKAAHKTKSIIIFDAAYSHFIRDNDLPKSIFEIPGAGTCAIEINSFSKTTGFTGVRLGWSIVPKALKYSSGESVNDDWNRICTTIFNGASNIAQAGGLAALEDDGLKEMERLCDFYLENTRQIKTTLEKGGISCTGGEASPYVWAHFPGRESWEVFSEILTKCRLITTPGSGFGPAGNSFIRFSGFGHKENVEEACLRLERYLLKI
ncbi:MAG: LL-diaminopimelate aminotransferase [Treponema sp.]|nr:LL-diaminopimelate aminotransferase [Treponema sp.]